MRVTVITAVTMLAVFYTVNHLQRRDGGLDGRLCDQRKLWPRIQLHQSFSLGFDIHFGVLKYVLIAIGPVVISWDVGRKRRNR